jgi:hypothetical protein
MSTRWSGETLWCSSHVEGLTAVLPVGIREEDGVRPTVMVQDSSDGLNRGAGVHRT